MDNEQQGLDANKVIDKLAQQIADKSREVAVVKTQYDELWNAYVKQQELVDAYEEKYGDANAE